MISISCILCKDPAEFTSTKYPGNFYCVEHTKTFQKEFIATLLPFPKCNILISQCKMKLINKRQEIAKKVTDISIRLIETIENNLNLYLKNLDKTLSLEDDSNKFFYNKDNLIEFLRKLNLSLEKKQCFTEFEGIIKEFLPINRLFTILDNMLPQLNM